MPQVQLPIFPAGSVEINRDLACRTDGDQVVYFNGHLPVFTHAKDDLASFRLFTSQLIVQGSATQGHVAKAFGVPLYVGLTKDLPRRHIEHARRQSPSTRRLQGELELIYRRDFPTYAQARRYEKFLKSGAGEGFLESAMQKLGLQSRPVPLPFDLRSGSERSSVW